jgi:hypothetical protein
MATHLKCKNCGHIWDVMVTGKCPECHTGIGDWDQLASKEEVKAMVQQAGGFTPGVAEALVGGVGVKHDLGKPRMELLDPYTLEQVALVLTFGARKYAAFNWANGIAYGRLLGAALRHIFAYMRGQDLDEETGLPHIAHAIAELMFLMGMSQRHPELDDREKGSGNAKQG